MEPAASAFFLVVLRERTMCNPTKGEQTEILCRRVGRYYWNTNKVGNRVP